MDIIKKSSSGMQVMPIESIIRTNGIIYLYGPIDDDMAMDTIKQITCYAIDEAVEEIHMFINSPGGEIDSGMLIYDVIQSSPIPIKMYCTGLAASMAALLFSAGKHGRYILPHSKVMIHEPLLASGIGGKTTTIQHLADSLLQLKNNMVEILAVNTGQPKRKLAAMLKNDTFFTGEEAVEFGLADEVIGLAEMLKGGK